MLAPNAQSSCSCRQRALSGAAHPLVWRGGAPAQRTAGRRWRRGSAGLVAVAAQPPQQQQQLVLSGEWYEDIVDQLAARVVAAAGEQPAGSKFIVGIAGAPGSGKSTLAQLLCRRINETWPVSAACEGAAPPCVVVPMDGFHYYKRQLDAMPDPKEAYARRGAHWTFDADAFVACVRRIREQGAAPVPSFDHGVGDPVEGDISVEPGTRVVLVEGNYLFLDDQPWAQLRGLFDDTVFVDAPIDLAMRRVFERQTSIGLAPEVSRARIAGNDRPNAELVAATAGTARVVVPSSVPLGSGSGGSGSGGSGNGSGSGGES